MRLPTALAVATAGSTAASDPGYTPSLGPDLPCPVNIRATVPGTDPFSTMAEVHRALAICPTVQSVQLRIGGYGCICPDSRELPIHPDAIQQYQCAPEVLELGGYAWGSNPHRSLGSRLDAGLLPDFSVGRGHPHSFRWSLDTWLEAWRWRFNNWAEWRRLASYTKEQLEIDNMALLLSSLDTSHVHTLGIKTLISYKGDRPDFTGLAHALPALKTLTIWGDLSTCRRKVLFEVYRDPADDEPSNDEENDCNPVPTFIGALSPSSLTNLTWLNGNDTSSETLAAVLDRHGSTLEHLQWRTDEPAISIRSFFSPDSLRALGAGAPHLSSLAVDLDRSNSTWPTAHLEAIAESMPNLTSLTLYFPLSNVWEPYDWHNMVYGNGRRVGDDGRVVEDNWVADNNDGGLFMLEQKVDLRDDQQYMLFHDEEEESIYQPRIRKYAAPLLTSDAAAKMFDTLQAAKVGNPLETVQFRVGDWARSYSRRAGDFRHWLDGRRAWFSCSSLRDDGTPKAEGEAPCIVLRLTRPADKVHGLAEWADIAGGVVIDKPYEDTPWHGDEGALDGNGNPCKDPNWDSWWRWRRWW